MFGWLLHLYFERKLYRSFVSEFVGTGLLLFTIVTASVLAPAYASFAIAAQLVALTYIGGGINNPAILSGVSIVRLRRALVASNSAAVKAALKQWLMLCIVELLGGFVGAWVGYGVLGTELEREQFPAPMPNNKYDGDVGRSATVEFVFTFQLVLVTLFTCVAKIDSPTNPNRFLGPSLGCVVFIGVNVAGGISGASFNPAVATALQLIQCFTSRSSSKVSCRPLSFFWLYWLTEIGAGIVAAIVFVLASTETDGEREYIDEEADEASLPISGEVEAPADSDNKIIYGTTNATDPRSSARISLNEPRRSQSQAQRRSTQQRVGQMPTLADLGE